MPGVASRPPNPSAEPTTQRREPSARPGVAGGHSERTGRELRVAPGCALAGGFGSKYLRPRRDERPLALVPPRCVLDETHRHGVLNVRVTAGEPVRDYRQASSQHLNIAGLEPLNRKPAQIADEQMQQDLIVELSEVLVDDRRRLRTREYQPVNASSTVMTVIAKRSTTEAWATTALSPN